MTGAPADPATGATVPAIEADDLRRDFRARTGWLRRQYRTVHAVRDVSLRIERDTLFGLLGPNGAGKTTTIKMLDTLLIPTGAGERAPLRHPQRRPPQPGPGTHAPGLRPGR